MTDNPTRRTGTSDSVAHSYLCVGGPYDGNKFASHSAHGFKVAVMPREEPPEIDHIYYHARTIHISSRGVKWRIWTLEHMDNDDIIEMLITGYRGVDKCPDA